MRRSVRRLRVLALPLLLVASAVACASDTPPQTGSTSRPGGSTSPSASPTPERSDGPTQVAEVPEVLRFSAPQLSGGTIDGESFAGSDVALWFWAPW